MKSCLALAALLVFCTASAWADDPCPPTTGQHSGFLNWCDRWRQRCCWCPDDYCPKPLPCVSPNAKGCGNDYCPRPLPCVTPNAKGCGDDYCPRGCLIPTPKLCEPWYRCGPPACVTNPK